MDWMFSPHTLSSYVEEAPISNVKVFGGRTFGKWLGHRSKTFINEINVHMEGIVEENDLSLLHVRREQEHIHLQVRNWTYLHFELGFPRLQDYEKQIFIA